MNYPTPSETAHAVRVVVGRLRRRLREIAAGELTPSQASVLTRLAKGEAATASALAAIEGVRPQSIASTLQALEQAGLIARFPDPQDGRRAIVEVTQAGLAEERGNRAAREEWLTDALEHRLSAEERRTVRDAMTLLERLVQA